MNASRFGNFQGVILLTDLIGKMVSIEEWLICLNDKLVGKCTIFHGSY